MVPLMLPPNDLLGMTQSNVSGDILSDPKSNKNKLIEPREFVKDNAKEFRFLGYIP